LRSGIEREPNALGRKLAEFAESGRSLLDLTVGNPTALGLRHDAATVLGALASERVLAYEPEPFGPRFAREAVCDTFAELGCRVNPEQIVLTASTSEAYAFLLKLLCDPGDEVLVPAPSYPLLEHLARFEAVQTRPYHLAYDGAWHIDFSSLVRAIGPRSRAILVVNPNNPTGQYLDRAELGPLLEFGLPLISDEVFASYPLEAGRDRVRSVLEADHGLVFALSGLSKLAALPQMKLAWIAAGGAPESIREALARLELIADAFLSANAPALHALPTWLATRQPLHTALRARLAHNLETLTRALAGSPLSRLRVEGGWYAVLRLPATDSDEGWTLGLLEETGVLVHPGYFFDFEGPPHAVVSLISEQATFAEGIGRLVDYVAAR
jgi:aspartate/methionine/tyrosine aminotransferase